MNSRKITSVRRPGLRLALAALALLGAGALQAAAPAPLQAMHPGVALLDAQGQNVLRSGQAVSTMKTCGQCHDTGYIASHAFHADLGLQSLATPEKSGWEGGNGFFGRWDPLRYRYLTRAGDAQLDLSTPGWLMAYGERVVGGGPATTSRLGTPLGSLAPDAQNPEAALLGANGRPGPWNWAASGTVEMNCFLCHIAQPNLAARAQALRAGRFGDANTATLTGLGIVEPASGGKGWSWNRAAFSADGLLDSRKLGVQDPTNANCAACHGEAHPGSGTAPIQPSACDPQQPWSATTGQVISGQRMRLSGMNLAGKARLNRSWDVHAERQLQCTDCHHARNNPAHARADLGSRPTHLRYDPRTVDIGEYLRRPDHDVARGPGAHSAPGGAAGEMRRCASCHDANASHAAWLPYVQTHMATLACEACHIPHQYAPAIQSWDWTVLTPEGQPLRSCRGVQGPPDDVRSLVDGFAPVLLGQRDGAGQPVALAPYNLVTTFYWIHDDAAGNTRPVRLHDLQAAFFGSAGEGAARAYAAPILAAFDANGDGRIDAQELRLDSPAKQSAVAARLQALGLKNPRPDGQVQPYAIHHGVARGAHALNDCTACHGKDSRLQQGMQLAGFAPVLPHLAPSANAAPSGALERSADGALRYAPALQRDGIYVFGASRIAWVDAFGALAFVGTLLGVCGHGLMRFLASRRRLDAPLATHPVQMYDAYRRFWHWLQATSIIVLLATGIVIHRPDLFAQVSFPAMVTLHNVVAVLLALNAALSLFYHLATERMREYLPRPQGFIDDSIAQARFYIAGIFRGEPHPFEKRPDDRMNPIQKLTYFGVLNGLLPAQLVTGALMWGLQYRPDIALLLGGLPLLAPLHTLLAWLFATFIVGHVYLTTTGPTPLEGIRAMVTGVEEVEDHPAAPGH